MPPPRIQSIAVEDLRLDTENPRLPEELQGSPEPEILTYLWENAVLDELIRSFLDNGFFEHEPLIVVPEGDGFTALEGNRRLASLMVLLGAPEAIDQGLSPGLENPMRASQRRKLSAVPALVVDNRDEVHKYLGFRHIGGIKRWSAEAKARYLTDEADRAAEAGDRNPFLVVGRRVGSNSQGVRNAYTALGVLRQAREEFGIDVHEVLNRRFGVWTRCMTAADVRRFVGLNGARSYNEVRQDISRLAEEPLREVIGDLTSRGEKPPLVNDSRQVTVYGQVLRHPVAYRVLRDNQSLDVARQIVEMAELPQRVDDLRERVDVARDEAERAEWSKELEEAVERLFRAARALRSTVRDLNDDEDDE